MDVDTQIQDIARQSMQFAGKVGPWWGQSEPPPHAGKVGPGRLCPVFCPTLPKPWAKWAIMFISIYLTCLIYIIRYR